MSHAASSNAFAVPWPNAMCASSKRAAASSSNARTVVGRSSGERERAAIAARRRRADAVLDVAAQLRLRAEQEESFRANEERPDEELLRVVEESGLHPLELVPDELDQPAGGEDRSRPGERLSRGGARRDLARPRAHEEKHRGHRDAERDI